MPESFATLDGVAQAGLVADGEVAPAELVAAAIARAEAVDPALNAIIHPQFEAALEAANGPLPGGPLRAVPFLLKDLGCFFEGDPTHSGSRYLKNADYRASYTTALAAMYRAAGLVTIGRTNTPEFGTVTVTEPLAHGPSRNPFDPSRSPGGSSGGAAAAVAAGIVPAAHASDGGGSIRVPASHCGLFGLKPSRGRITHAPAFGEIWLGCATDHCVSVSVRDSALLLDVSSLAHAGDPYIAPPPAESFLQSAARDPGQLRIGLMRQAPAAALPIEPDCLQALDTAVERLEALGHRIESAYPGALDEVDEDHAFMRIVSCWTAAEVAAYEAELGRSPGPNELEPGNWLVIEQGRSVSATDYLAAQCYLQQWARRICGWWDHGFDLLLTPVAARAAPAVGEAAATPDDPMRALRGTLPYVTFTSPFNVTGQPAASIPMTLDSGGVPVGVQLVARYGREDLLLQLAAQLERAAPWAGRLPRTAPVG